MITVGYAAAHPRLKALDFQPSALLLSEAAAVYLKIFVEIRVKTTNDSGRIQKKPNLHSTKVWKYTKKFCEIGLSCRRAPAEFRKIRAFTAQNCGNTQKNSVK